MRLDGDPWARVRRLPGLLKRIAKFGLVGVLNTLIDIGLFWLLFSVFGVPYLMANVLSYGAGMLNSFVMNKLWTFSERRKHGLIRRQLPIFVAVNLVSLALSSLILWALAPSIGVMPAKLAGTLASFVTNFWASQRFVYRAAPAASPPPPTRSH